MEEVTNLELLQAIKEISNDVRGIDEKVDGLDKKVENLNRIVGNLEGKLSNLKVEIKEFNTEVKLDIRKLDQKFTLVLEDLHQARTDIHFLQRTAKR